MILGFFTVGLLLGGGMVLAVDSIIIQRKDARIKQLVTCTPSRNMQLEERPHYHFVITDGSVQLPANDRRIKV